MTAKEAFEKIGYKQVVVIDSDLPTSNGIQYIKKDEESELQRKGMLTTKYIEFYFMHKEIAVYTTYKHRNGNTSKSDVGILNYEEFNAVQKQVEELKWENNNQS